MLRSSCEQLCFMNGACSFLQIRELFCQFCVCVYIVHTINIVNLQSIFSAEGSQTFSQAILEKL